MFSGLFSQNSTLFVIILMALGTALSTVIAAYETALQYLSLSKLADLLAQRQRTRGFFLNAILNDLPRYRFSATFIATGGFGATLIYCFDLLAETKWGAAFFIGILLVIAGAGLRGLAEITGDLFAERLVILLAPPMWILTLLTSWLTRPFYGFYRLLARGAGYDLEKKHEDFEEEVIAAVSDGEIAGVVNEDQRKMIERVFDFEHTDVADVLTPRTDVEMLDVSLSLPEVIAKALESGYSRIPVYENTRDNVIGIFYIRDALNYWGKAEIPEVREMLHKPLFVPETKNIGEMLALMKRSQTQIAIVLDEYGGTAGLVTFEDLLEEIVGNVRDEYDSGEPNYLVRTLAPGHIIADGHVHVSDINDALGLSHDLIPEDQDYDTVGGFLSFTLGYIPQTGEEFTRDTLKVKVLSADERRVKRVEIRHLT